MSRPIVEKLKMDRKDTAESLVEKVGQLETKMADIFPMYFYAETANQLVQIRTRDGRVQIGTFKTTDDWVVNRVMNSAGDLQTILSVATNEWQLFDLKTLRLIVEKDMVWNNGPMIKGATFGRSTVDQQFYTFDCPSWILTVLNYCAKTSRTENPTLEGVHLFGYIVGQYFSMREPDHLDLSWLNNVDIPRGTNTIPLYKADSLKRLEEFAEKRKDSFRPSDAPDRLSLLSIVMAESGIPAEIVNRSINFPLDSTEIIVDTMQDKLKALTLCNGTVRAEVFSFADNINTTLATILKTPVYTVISTGGSR